MLKRINYILISVILFVIILSGQVLSAFSFTAFAEEKTITDETNVIDDLSYDSDFDIADYPQGSAVKAEVIQIAVVNDDLYLYVYQPNYSVPRMSKISISFDDVDLSFTIFDLIFCNSSETLTKYVVRDSAISSNAQKEEQVYFISALYYPTNVMPVDLVEESLNTINFVALTVGQVWRAYNSFGTYTYEMNYLDVIEVEQKHVGFIRYNDLKLFNNSSCTDSHYIAFSVKRPIDDLLEADVYFTYKTVHHTKDLFFLDKWMYGDVVEEYKTLKRNDIFEKSTWWDCYKYNRIQSMSEFLSNETEVFTEEAKSALIVKDWVLRFHESPYYLFETFTTSPDSPIQNIQTDQGWTEVSNVAILRLEYEYNGKIYNVGVVDHMQSGSRKPDNVVDAPEFPWWLIMLLIVVGVILLIPLLPFLVMVVKAIFQILWWVICSPFKLVKWIIDKVRYKK